MTDLHIFDIIVLVLVGWLTLRGGMKGFVTQLTTIASVIISWIVAVKFSPVVAPMLPVDAPWNKPIAMLLLFVGASLVVWILHGFIEGIISAIRLKNFDRHLGALLGMVKGLLLCLIVTFFAVTVSDKTKAMVVDSYSGKYFVRGISTVASLIPEDVCVLLHKNFEGFEQCAKIADEIDELKTLSGGESLKDDSFTAGSISDSLKAGWDRLTDEFSSLDKQTTTIVSQPQDRFAESKSDDYLKTDTYYDDTIAPPKTRTEITPYHPSSGSYLPVIPRR